MGFELNSGFLTMTDRETGNEYNFGEVAYLGLEQLEWSKDAEPARIAKGFANSGTFSCEGTTVFNQELFDELCNPSTSSEFTMECDTPILIQARWHKKARIRKKWLKRYGYKEDVAKMIMRARQGEFNTETGECAIDVDSIEYKFKPYQMVREVRRV